MSASIERMRLWIVGAGVLLVLGILLFFAYARWQVRRIAHDLPAKLGVSIQQSTNGFTLSKSEGGHTLFTLHAAKVLQYRGAGRAELNGVSITVYAPDGAPADYIFGNDFEYDPAGVIQAKGEVQIDLQGLSGNGTKESSGAADETENRHIVHVKTSDLIFNQKAGTASTTQQIEFRIADAAGSATGADFDTRTGTVALKSNVALESSVNGHPLTVRANRAQYDRVGQVLHLAQSRTEYQDGIGSCDQASVYFRDDGSAARVDAQGQVSVKNGQGTVTAQEATAFLDPTSKPIRLIFNRNVQYRSRDPKQRILSTSNKAVVLFGSRARLQHVRLEGAVSVTNQETPSGNRSASASAVKEVDRNLKADAVDVHFAAAPDQHAEARDIVASGNASFNIHNIYLKSGPQDTTVSAELLHAILAGGTKLESLRGDGNAHLVQLSPKAMRQSASGNTLLMKFQSPSGKKARAPSEADGATELESSELNGNVTLAQTSVDRKRERLDFRAKAERASYISATQVIHLTGNPRVYDSSGEIAAADISINRSTGNAEAAGAVQVTFRSQSESSQPPPSQGFSLGGTQLVHLAAARANLDRAKDLSTFYGSGGQKAKIWQGPNSISAPILEISSQKRTWSAPGGAGPVVDAVFESNAKDSAHALRPGSAANRNPLVQIASNTLYYSDAEAKADFRGAVVARDATGSMRSDSMDVYFTDSGGVNKSGVATQLKLTSGSRQSSGRQLERMVAEGDVRIDMPGRQASGSKLTYTIQDGRFVLSGNESKPPRLVDEVHGTVTGSSLIFNDRDDSVVVSGGSSRAVTETRTAK